MNPIEFFYKSSQSDLLLYFYPVCQDTEYELVNTGTNIENAELLSRALYNWQISQGLSSEDQKVKSLWDNYNILNHMKEFCRFSSKEIENLSFLKNHHIFLTASPNAALTVQGFSHAAYNKTLDEVEILNFAPTPWNFDPSYAKKLGLTYNKEAEKFILEHTIGLMNVAHPDKNVFTCGPKSIARTCKDLGFEITSEVLEGDGFGMHLNAKKAAVIGSKVLKTLRK